MRDIILIKKNETYKIECIKKKENIIDIQSDQNEFERGINRKRMRNIILIENVIIY